MESLKKWRWATEVLDDKKWRKNNAPILKFGIEYLDKAFDGISRTDVILLGAPSGAGKTEMASSIACNISTQGKKVLLFALEADESEIENRLYFRILSRLYWQKVRSGESIRGERPNYVSYCAGRLDSIFQEFEEQATEEARVILKNLAVRYNFGGFNQADLDRELLSATAEFDCVILDHVNYIDLEGQNENREMTKIMQSVRDIALIQKKPIILVAHLRKQDSRFKTLLPNLEDFHGSSNIFKIATKAILIAPTHEVQSPTLFPTLMKIAKFRRDGSRTRYVARVNFDITKNSYEENFEIGFLSSNGQAFERIDDPSKIPYWSR